MSTENGTVPKGQTGSDSKKNSRIRTIGNWIINNSDVILKLTGSIAILIGTLIVANYESKMSAITLINQREQAESELRSNMFSHLIAPISGPYMDNEEIDPHRECVLIKLLALNFHEHFEFKPLMLHVDKRLAGMYRNDYSKEEKSAEEKQAELDRNSLRSIARRVADRQIAMLIKEGAREPVSLEIEVPGKDEETDFLLYNEDFGDIKLVKKLLEKGIVKRDNEDSDYLYFNDSIEKETQLLERLKKAGFKEYDEIRSIKRIWRQHQNTVTPEKNEKVIKVRYHQYVELKPPKSKGKSSLTVILGNVDWKNETVDIEFTIKTETNNISEEASQDFTLTWYDFPLTDNTLLSDGNRFSLVLADIDGDDPSEGGIVTIKIVWYPKEYFTARERPINYQEFREKLGI